MSQNTETLVSELNKCFTNNSKIFEPFIQWIRFPVYKHLENNTRIDFSFPVTVLIGENGCNKTSVLQALYGCPNNHNVSEYWFGTKLDIINDSENRSCFIYAYINPNLNQAVEVLQTRIQKPKNPDYWESSRAVKKYDMKIPDKGDFKKGKNKSYTRWDQINKPLVYCDCNEYISAFDLLFYHTSIGKKAAFTNLQSYIRTKSKILAKVIRDGKTSFVVDGKELIKESLNLSSKACEAVSKIMGENYSAIRIITHSIYSRGSYRLPAKTIWIKKNDESYSEAFAGTGESRIVLLINDIINAPENALLLIDEPEISLHPRAIKRLKNYILTQALTKHLQVVITTHSPYMVEGLPEDSIKYMSELDSGAINISDKTPDAKAVFEISDTLKPLNVFVEDKLSAVIVERVLQKQEDDYLRNKINVRILGGGADNMISHFIPTTALTGQYNDYYILDGDKKNLFDSAPYNKIINEKGRSFNEKELTSNQRNPAFLDKLIKDITGHKIDFHPSGNGGNNNFTEEITDRETFLKYWMSNVCFLPEDTPEKAIIKELYPDKFKGLKNNGKSFFKNIASEKYDIDNVESSDIFSIERICVAKLKPNCPTMTKILEIIKYIINNK